MKADGVRLVLPGSGYVSIILLDLSYLDLALRHAQGVCEPRSLRTRQVLGLFKSLFQRKDLLSGESGPGVFPLPVLVQ